MPTYYKPVQIPDQLESKRLVQTASDVLFNELVCAPRGAYSSHGPCWGVHLVPHAPRAPVLGNAGLKRHHNAGAIHAVSGAQAAPLSEPKLKLSLGSRTAGTAHSRNYVCLRIEDRMDSAPKWLCPSLRTMQFAHSLPPPPPQLCHGMIDGCVWAHCPGSVRTEDSVDDALKWLCLEDSMVDALKWLPVPEDN
eukprot:scaffold114450_cov21-Tisochrysis_lutea.AAC.1